MHYTENPPDASSLMISARSFGNYDLPSALSDLVDNSIKAGAHLVNLKCIYNGSQPTVSVLDDGCGMSKDELLVAMRPASTNPLAYRSPDDLGRFGWGMKSASFSQCRQLIVISRRNGELSAASWDLKDVDHWKMGILSDQEIAAVASPELLTRDGTEVLWQDCDRLSENGKLTEDEFNILVVHARSRIALTFHRYLSGAVPGKKKLSLRLNGQLIVGHDPFYRENAATQQLELEEIQVHEGAKVRIQPFILPHYSKLKLSEYDQLGGEEGFLKNQGFYVYRNYRLIISGTWFRLVRHGELSQLVRICIDIPNSLDSSWKITIDKSDAQLPTALRSRLKNIVDGLKRRSARVFRSKGGNIDVNNITPVWSRHVRNGEIKYSINREHPLVAALLSIDDSQYRGAADAVFKVIEQRFPVTTFGGDASINPDAIHQTEGNPREFLAFLETSLPLMLANENGDIAGLIRRLQGTEPFSQNWRLTEELLVKKGWINA